MAWTAAGVYFVTRLNDNFALEVVEECQLPSNRGIRHLAVLDSSDF